MVHLIGFPEQKLRPLNTDSVSLTSSVTQLLMDATSTRESHLLSQHVCKTSSPLGAQLSSILPVSVSSELVSPTS